MCRREYFSASCTAQPKEACVPDPSLPAADQVLDCAGMSCPLPVVKTSQAIKKLEIGQVLELLATDPGVEPDMKAWSGRTGHELLSIARTGEVFHVLIRRLR
jgi:tRNA 2-thiouridine synthesizing protein A